MAIHNSINYIEFPVKDIPKTKAFFAKVFGWEFIDYGEEYCSVSNAAVDAGFFVSDKTMSSSEGSALIVLYSNQLETTLDNVVEAGGKIIKPVFSFPGGRRFHFCDLNENEFAVWSE